MCSMSAVMCPLCTQTSFNSIDALRDSLIKAANGPLSCPICHDLFLGLDKLTIHLFSHTTSNLTSAATKRSSITTTKITATTTTTAAPATTTVTVTTGKFEINEKVSPSSPSPPTKTTNTTQLTTTNAALLNTQAMTTPSRKEKKTKKIKQIENTIEKQEKTLNVLGRNHESNKKPANTSSPPIIATTASTASPAATCDICELNLRNEQLRDMHLRLVHQNLPIIESEAGNAAISPVACNTVAGATNKLNFKCHLCAKTFKMKGSLRVHLRVVHYVNNLNKVNTESAESVSITAPLPLPITSRRVQPLQQEQGICVSSNHELTVIQRSPQTAITTTTPPPAASFSIGTLTLLPASLQASNDNVRSLTTGSVLNINANGELVQSSPTESGALNSNVLLVFNTSSAGSNVLSSSSQQQQSGAATLLQSDFDKDSLTKLSSDNPKIWECDVCSKSFTTKYFLKKHKRLHTGEMPYTCEICSRTFTFQQSYHKHLLYHSDEKPHVCPTCGRAFKELSTLHNHERIHSGEKPFKCEVCGKCFRQRVSFLVHTRIHTGVMPYKCDICQKSFRYKVSQRTHKCLVNTNDIGCQPAVPENAAGGVVKETVDQISENFIKAFLESTTSGIAQLGVSMESQNSPTSVEIAAITDACNNNGSIDAKTSLDEALLSKTIDDIVVESCNRMGIGNENNAGSMSSMQAYPSIATNFNNFTRRHCIGGENVADGGSLDCVSPSQKLQDMRLYSPPQIANVEEDVGTGFPHFLLDEM